MKPFNLSDALNNKPVVTRDGREVTEIHLFKTAKSDKCCLAGVIHDEINTFYIDGKYLFFVQSCSDLFMATEKEDTKKESDEKTILKLWAFMILNKIFEKF